MTDKKIPLHLTCFCLKCNICREMNYIETKRQKNTIAHKYECPECHKHYGLFTIYPVKVKA